MAPAKRTLHEGMSVLARPWAIVLITSWRLLIWAWPKAAPPQTVWRLGTGTTVPLKTFWPPWSPGPWQRSQLKPSWFSSVPGIVVRRPRSTDCWMNVTVSALLVSFSRRNTVGSQMAMMTTSSRPHAISFSRTGFSRSGSEGPGRMPGGMSISGGRWGRRRPARSAPAASTTARPAATPYRMARPAEMAASTVIPDSPGRPSPPGRPSHAERALGRLVDGVRSARRAGGRASGVHFDLAPLHLDGEALQAVGSRPELPLAGVVVLGPVAGAFEPLALLAERHPASQVGALLIEGHEPVRRQPLVQAARLVSVAGVVDQVEPPRPEVEGLAAALDLVEDRISRVGERDDRSEPALQLRPQEGEGCPAELRAEDHQRGQQPTPEEVPARQHHLGLRGCRTSSRSRPGGPRSCRRGRCRRPPGADERSGQQDQEQSHQDRHDPEGEDGRGDGKQQSHRSKNNPWLHGHTQLNPGPRKNDPMMVRVAPNMNSIVNSVMMSLRSPGLVLGLRSM